MQSTKRLKKVEIADTVAEKIGKSKSMVITDYRGLTTAQLNELRQKLADLSAEYQIAKNTLVKRVLHQKGLDVTNEVFDGPTAILYAYEDEISPIKALIQFAKGTKLPVLKGGYLDGKAVSAQQVDALASLPSKDILRAQVVGTMYAPVNNFVGVLNANLTGLLNVLNAIKEKAA